MRRFVCGLLLLGLGLMTPVQAQPQTSTAPYIQYYSDALNGWVIERADGTDSRVIGQGTVRRGDDWFYGPGWSPSGRYFAWNSTNFVWEGTEPILQGGVIAVNGDVPHKSLIRMEAVHLQWAPNADMLAVIRPLKPIVLPNEGQPTQPTSGLWLFNAFVISLPDNRIVARLGFTAQREYMIGLSERDVSAPAWSPDGEQLRFTYRRGGYTLVTINVTDGQTTQRALEPQTFTPNPLERERFSLCNPDHVTRYQSESQTLIIEQLNTGVVQTINTSFAENVTQLDFWWDTSGAYALVAEYTTAHSIVSPQLPYRYWRLTLATGDLRYIGRPAEAATLAPLYSAQPRTENWSNIQRMCNSTVPDHFLMRQPHTELLFVLNLTSGYQTPLPQLHRYGELELRWTETGAPLAVFRHTPPLAYDLQSGHLSPIQVGRFPDLDLDSADQLYQSPDKRFIGDDDYRVVDSYSGETFVFPQHSQSAGGIISLEWHPDAPYAIVWENAILAGGVNGFSHSTVTNLQGHVRRELNTGFPASTLAGWLPDRAIPHLQPGGEVSVQIAPMRTKPAFPGYFGYYIEDTNTLECDVSSNTAWIVHRSNAHRLYALQADDLCVEDGLLDIDIYFTVSASRHWLVLGLPTSSQTPIYDLHTGQLIYVLDYPWWRAAFSGNDRELYTHTSRHALIWDFEDILHRAEAETHIGLSPLRMLP